MWGCFLEARPASPSRSDTSAGKGEWAYAEEGVACIDLVLRQELRLALVECAAHNLAGTAGASPRTAAVWHVNVGFVCCVQNVCLLCRQTQREEVSSADATARSFENAAVVCAYAQEGSVRRRAFRMAHDPTVTAPWLLSFH